MRGNKGRLRSCWNQRWRRRCVYTGIIAAMLLAGERGGAQSAGAADADLWSDGLGRGFRSEVQSFSLEAGADYGLAAFGSRQAHDIGVVSIGYSHMLGQVVGGDHWYRGNWEGRLELFGGSQFSPTPDWLVGFTPHLRYNLSTGTRWVPFIDGGAGLTATQIGLPDLSSTFEFNLQGGLGTQWFLRDNVAVTMEARYFHLSDAGMSRPNFGVNGVAALVGLTWFF